MVLVADDLDSSTFDENRNTLTKSCFCECYSYCLVECKKLVAKYLHVMLVAGDLDFSLLTKIETVWQSHAVVSVIVIVWPGVRSDIRQRRRVSGGQEGAFMSVAISIFIDKDKDKNNDKYKDKDMDKDNDGVSLGATRVLFSTVPIRIFIDCKCQRQIQRHRQRVSVGHDGTFY